MTSTSPTAAAPAVLHFWFEELSEEQHWRKDPAMDREIAKRFGAVRETALKGKAKGWRETPEVLLAAIILLDQFSRNLHRGRAKAFEADPLALELAFEALDKGWSHAAPDDWRAFLLMPLMHSERPEVQVRCVAEFRLLGDQYQLGYATMHRDQIQKFGRFPGRNKALGRVSTPEERQALEAGAAF